MCEAMLLAFEATNEVKFLDRAPPLAKRYLRRFGRESGRIDLGTLPDRLVPRLDYNKDDPKNLFKPYGYLPGSFYGMGQAAAHSGALPPGRLDVGARP